MTRVKPLPIPLLGLGCAAEVEQQFYAALRRADLEALMALWADDDDVVCVHPGGTRVIGPAAVRASFEALFASGAIDIHPEKLRCLEAPAFAVHSVVERVQVRGAPGQTAGWVIATNAYVETPLGWRIVAHHASPGVRSEPQDGADPAAVLH
ncbi:MAG: nuclear transport factor 2 family protein [Burkholderiaceae bacterium]